MKFNRLCAFSCENLHSVLCLRGVTAGLSGSPGLLICAAHRFFCFFCRRFEIPSLTGELHLSQQTQRKRKRRRREGGVKREKPSEAHLSPPSASQHPTGRHYLSVKSQVTTLAAQPREGRHFRSHLLWKKVEKRKEIILRKVSARRKAEDKTSTKRKLTSCILCLSFRRQIR